jgi:hypothetical protein
MIIFFCKYNNSNLLSIPALVLLVQEVLASLLPALNLPAAAAAGASRKPAAQPAASSSKKKRILSARFTG